MFRRRLPRPLHTARRPFDARRWIAGWGGALALLGCSPKAAPTQAPVDATSAQRSGSAAEIAVDPKRMFTSLETLASDEYAGRYTLTEPDLARAADYLAAEYEKVGLSPVLRSYRAPFAVEWGSEPGPDLHFWIEDDSTGEVVSVPDKNFAVLDRGDGTAVFGDAVFVGGEVPKSVHDALVVSHLGHEASTAAVTERAVRLKAAGARAVVMVVPARPTTPDRIELGIPLVLIAEQDAKPLLNTEGLQVGATMADLKLSLAAKQVPVVVPSYNVLAWIEGSERPDEIVILGAHYDHIGVAGQDAPCDADDGDTICNGADDNGSGTAMVLEIARAMALAGYKPARSLVFAHFAGEELGLHGSRGLADNPPDAAPFNTGNVVAMVNLDMVGRYREKAGLQVGGLSSSDDWRPLLDAAGSEGLRMIYERSVTGRSDHANFYRKKIPVLFFFTGLHSDYHRVGDHADKINQGGMAAIAKIVSRITVALANGADVAWSEPRSASEGAVSRLPGSDATTVEN